MIYELSIAVDNLALSDLANLLQNQAERMLRWQQATESLQVSVLAGSMLQEFTKSGRPDNRITQSIIED